MFQPSFQIAPLRLSQVLSRFPFFCWDGLLQVVLLVLEVLATGVGDVEASATVTIPNPETELTERTGPKMYRRTVVKFRTSSHLPTSPFYPAFPYKFLAYLLPISTCGPSTLRASAKKETGIMGFESWGKTAIQLCDNLWPVHVHNNQKHLYFHIRMEIHPTKNQGTTKKILYD